MFGEWHYELFQDAYGQNWIAIISRHDHKHSEVVIWLYPNELDRAWSMCNGRNDVARRAREMDALARAA